MQHSEIRDLDARPAPIPCQTHSPDLWFAEHPRELEVAKALCHACTLQRACLAAALQRGEPWGVWGGEILKDGAVLEVKRGRGRPPKAA